MILKLGMQYLGLKLYKIYLNGDPGLTLTFLRQCQIWKQAFLWEKVKTVDFSETIAVCDLKVGRCRQVIDLMKVCEY